MGKVEELIPGASEIRAELDDLRRLLQAMRNGGRVVNENGVDVTAEEIENLGQLIAALEQALGFRINGFRD